MPVRRIGLTALTTAWLLATGAFGAPEVTPPRLPQELVLQNPTLTLRLNVPRATLSLSDRRTGRSWTQHSGSAEVSITDARQEAGALSVRMLHRPTNIKLTVRINLESSECILRLSADGPLPRSLRWPYPFVAERGDYLVVPMNEGISYPVDDPSIDPITLIAYGGHGICMAFWGVTDGAAGHMAIIETPDDAAIRIARADTLLHIAPEWQPSRGQFGPERRLRYVFFAEGGHVAMCKRYRAYAQSLGLLKTFTEKARLRPNIDLLIGAANIWYFDRDALAVARELQQAGIDRILWSSQAPAETVRAMNDMGILTSRYDIYQDVMDPANFPRLRGIHADWTTPAWPADLMRRSDGDWVRGWGVQGKDGTMYSCGVLCDRQALSYAEQRIAADLAQRPYRCRFIDTTTASPWRECYDSRHPMTRSESRHYKMELLRLVSEKHKLVTGCETGHDAAVPFVDYFEGMLSLGPYRVPDSGRDIQRIWDEVPERVARFQMGYQYRLPLWELVYHDCVVAQWYWGDYNNKLPSLWDRRDLFNALYGTPPMFMFNRGNWQTNKERFVRSYRNTSPIARAAGYSEMADHRFLKPDRSVQRTQFANGVSVTVNFGDVAYRGEDGVEIKPGGIQVHGLKAAK